MTSSSSNLIDHIERLLAQLREEHELELHSLRSQLRQESSQQEKEQLHVDHAHPNGEHTSQFVAVSNTSSAEFAETGNAVSNTSSAEFAEKGKVVSNTCSAEFAEKGSDKKSKLSSSSDGVSMVHHKSTFPAHFTAGDKTMREAAPETGHANFVLRKEWSLSQAGSSTFSDTIDPRVADQHARQMLKTVHHRRFNSEHQDAGRSSALMQKARWIPILDPTCQQRVAWDLAGMALIGYDMISIPVHLSFEPDPTVFTDTMGWVTLLFWTCDMGWSCYTGYYEDGQLVMDHWSIIKNYLKGWFWIDCLVVVPDWVLKALGSMTNAAGLARVLRIARGIRVLRLLRLLKLQRLFNIVYDMLDSEVTFIIFNLLKMLIMIVFMNHIVACAWYMVGRLSKENGAPRNWLENAGMTHVWNEDLVWKYLTSLHWSITQFTPASMDISATNSPERLFSIIILFWALVALSSIIGSVSAAMTALRNMSADENKQFWVLRRYLRQNVINKSLSTRIMRYLEWQQVQKHNKVAPASVKLLSQLSKAFEIELAFELRSRFISDHPLFYHMAGDEELSASLKRICHSAVSIVATAEGEELFGVGDEGNNMYFVKKGVFTYTLIDGSKLKLHLGPKLWAGEAALWVAWRHRGVLTAMEPSESLAISPKIFREVMMIHPRPWYLAVKYGHEFVHYLNAIGFSCLTDVVFDEDQWTKVVEESDVFRLNGRTINSEEAESEEVRTTEYTLADSAFRSDSLGVLSEEDEEGMSKKMPFQNMAAI